MNDNGVVGFDYTAPVEITETTVTGAALRPFSQIRDTFETMVCVVNASENCDHALAIDRVRLSYSRISEPDRFDSGLIVPVWSFEGRNDEIYHFGEELGGGTQASTTRGTVLAINAIDGSVIDGAVGY